MPEPAGPFHGRKSQRFFKFPEADPVAITQAPRNKPRERIGAIKNMETPQIQPSGLLIQVCWGRVLSPLLLKARRRFGKSDMIPRGFRDVWDDQSVVWVQGLDGVPEPVLDQAQEQEFDRKRGFPMFF